MAQSLTQSVINRIVVNQPADYKDESYSGNLDVSSINSMLIHCRKENVRVFARITATQVWNVLGVVGDALDSVSGMGTEYRRDATFDVALMDRVSITSLGSETKARVIFNPTLPASLLTSAGGGASVTEHAMTTLVTGEAQTVTVGAGDAFVQVYDEVVTPGAGSTELDVLRLHLDSDFTDSSTSGHTVTAHGNAAISTSEKKFGAGSAYFDGSGDYLVTSDSNDLDFGTGAFTMEAWINTTDNAASTRIMSAGSHTDGANKMWFFGRANYGTPSRSMNFGYFNGGHYTERMVYGLSYTDGTWAHTAISRSGGNMYFFWNGQLVDTWNIGSSTVINSGTTGLLIGARRYQNSSQTIEYWNGYIDDVRITKGLARYTENFTVPAAAHPDANSAGTTELNATTSHTIAHDSTAGTVTITPASNVANAKLRIVK